jgi:hypothetical protein
MSVAPDFSSYLRGLPTKRPQRMMGYAKRPTRWRGCPASPPGMLGTLVPPVCWLLPDKIGTKSFRVFLCFRSDDYAPKPPLERGYRRCRARVLCGLLCCSRTQGNCFRESARRDYRCLGNRALRHIGFAARDRYRLPDLETFSQYEANSCSSDIPSWHICSCDHPGVLGPRRISSGNSSCVRVAREGQVGCNYRNLDCLGHRHSCVICSRSEPTERSNLRQLT